MRWIFASSEAFISAASRMRRGTAPRPRDSWEAPPCCGSSGRPAVGDAGLLGHVGDPAAVVAFGRDLHRRSGIVLRRSWSRAPPLPPPWVRPWPLRLTRIAPDPRAPAGVRTAKSGRTWGETSPGRRRAISPRRGRQAGGSGRTRRSDGQLLAVRRRRRRLDEELGQAHPQRVRQRRQRLHVGHPLATLDHRKERDADLRPLCEVFLCPALGALGSELPDPSADSLTEV